MVYCEILATCESVAAGINGQPWSISATGGVTTPAAYGTYSIYAERKTAWTDALCKDFAPLDLSSWNYLSIYLAGYVGTGPNASGPATKAWIYLHDNSAIGSWPYGHVAKWYIEGLSTTLTEFQLELNNSGTGIKPYNVESGFNWTLVNKIRLRGVGTYLGPSSYENCDIYFDYIRRCLPAPEAPGPESPEQEEQVETEARTEQEQTEFVASREAAGLPTTTEISRRRIKNESQIVGIRPAANSAAFIFTHDPTGSDWTQINAAPTRNSPSRSQPVTGQRTVAAAGTAVQLSTTTIEIRAITVRAHTNNAGDIYVGPSGVSATTGYILAAGETVSFNINDVSKIYVDAANGGDGVSYIAVV